MIILGKTGLCQPSSGLNNFMTLNTKLKNNKILFLFLACCLFSGCMDKKRNDGGGNPDIILLGEQKELGIFISHDYTVYMKVLKTVHSSDSGMTVVVSNALDVPMRYGEGWKLQKQTGDAWTDKGYRKDLDGFNGILPPRRSCLLKFPLGELEPGKYRIVKAFQTGRRNILQLGAKFEIRDNYNLLILPFWMLYLQDRIVLGFYDIVFSEDLPKSYPMYLINKTDCDITLGRAYRIEKYEKGIWSTVKGNSDFRDDALIVKPCRRSGWKGLGVYIPRMAKGLYRICKEADYDNRTHLITCEFYIY